MLFFALAACSVDRAGLGGDFDASITADANPRDVPAPEDAERDGSSSPDECPEDPTKTSPGVCGCGVPDTDTDLDGAADCIDACRTDPDKTDPGLCGCGVGDIDADTDGHPACNDCDDSNAEVSPSARERCNAMDDDCDGTADEDGACDSGCSDGASEVFTDRLLSPDLAGCAGGWDVPGLAAPRTCTTTGDDSTNQNGVGCAAVDLCQTGWHVCGQSEVSTCSDPLLNMLTSPTLFFAVVPGAACGTRALVGCGNSGPMARAECAPMTRETSPPCAMIGWPWRCSPTENAVPTVAKTAHFYGGVLCCRD